MPIGIVTDRDIVIETIALQLDADTFLAGDLMSAPIVTVTVGEDARFIETLRLMHNHKVRRMPVVTTADDTLFGAVTFVLKQLT